MAKDMQLLEKRNQLIIPPFEKAIYGTEYSRIDQVKFAGGSL